ncbi:hypothetical protein A2303_01165 [Candidatus Falkowbacteria bacterium RIFOXYB2_FULL_47_14]|uniref:Uncharacterized protein n=1 Tax=Candidatus Falkowbacteria bacterium RIFOXYA2_FULL_47_19 TaxID=1797994 RepID=A0A1F5SG17_9BACT|nr:MAG: hypothetical protein A2227_00365 [Candidatus Falkowbacteria bacterium RIFOXYA2_FULL_47_19]OGF35544.1 MAG: hypothetical protein A2468_05910 [Candidatus Falkowbacteria bacterium RIFOXYC2_FULL_46_15]OGF42973.1 MAG: hypothetical protein A2303_01165 [Candidatus Falkowbacteria bacterium RIFOXYB2_FULL_47_14]
MLEEFQKSIKAVLYDRLSSPLAGAFILSWFVWNWGLIYYILTGDETRYTIERIEYIKENFLSEKYILFFPLLSVIFLVFLYPFAANLVYRVMLMFNKQKRDIKIKIENDQCLTFRESVEIKETFRKQEEVFKKFNQDKDEKINILKRENDLLKNKIKKIENDNKRKELSPEEKAKIDKILIHNLGTKDDEFKKIIESKYNRHFLSMVKYINQGWGFGEDIDNNAVGFFIANDIIEQTNRASIYKLTTRGKEYLKYYYDNIETKN